MNKHLLLRIISCVCALFFFTDVYAQAPAPAQAEHTPDMFENDVVRRNEMIAPTVNTATQPDVEEATGKSFMQKYCDPGFVSMFANNQRYFGQEGCLKLIRDNACGRFKNLPPEVQSVLDDATGCIFRNGNGYAADKYQKTINGGVACGKTYMQRIELLKVYANDYYTNNALLYFPDDVLDTAGRCVNRSGVVAPKR